VAEYPSKLARDWHVASSMFPDLEDAMAVEGRMVQCGKRVIRALIVQTNY